MQRGFLTLEIVIAMTLLVSAFTAAVLLSSAQTLGADTHRSAEALTLARKAIETQQALGRKDFNLVVSTTSADSIGDTTYTSAVTVTQTDLFTKKVTATVGWPGTFGRTPSISLAMLVTNFENAVGGDTCSSVVTGDWEDPQVTNALFAEIEDIHGNALDPNADGAYPLSDVDAYRGRLYVALATSSSLAGPKSPTTAAADAGSVSWSNPDTIKTSDAGYSVATLASGQTTELLKATNFGFSIPQGATILGVKADVQRKGSSSVNFIKDGAIRLIRADGSLGSTNKAATTNWPTSEAYATYGGTTDLWGETGWTPASVNSGQFGLALAATSGNGSGSRTASVDHVRITVYYTKQFYILDIYDPAAPIFLGGLANSPLTSGINAIAAASGSGGEYTYAATNSSTGTNQLQVIDVADPTAPFITETFPTTSGTGMGRGVGTSIFYKNGYVYLGLTTGAGGPEFNSIDVAVNPAAPSWTGGYHIGSTVNAIVVKGNYAYLSTNDTARELMVLDVSNPAAPTLVTSYNATPDSTGWGLGRALSVVGDTAYLGRSWTNSAATPQFYRLDASTIPPSLAATSSLGSNLSLRGIIARDWLAALLLGSGSHGGQLQLVNATSTAAWAAPIALPGTGGTGGAALDCEGNHLFAASVDASNKGYLTIVTGD